MYIYIIFLCIYIELYICSWQAHLTYVLYIYITKEKLKLAGLISQQTYEWGHQLIMAFDSFLMVLVANHSFWPLNIGYTFGWQTKLASKEPYVGLEKITGLLSRTQLSHSLVTQGSTYLDAVTTMWLYRVDPATNPATISSHPHTQGTVSLHSNS